MKKVIFGEDHATEEIAKTLIPKQVCSNIYRASGISDVSRKMETIHQNSLVIAIIDNDKKNIPGYFIQDFTVCFTFKDCYFVIKCNKGGTLHYIVVLSPASDQWLRCCAEAVKITTEEYNLGTTLKEFTKVTKRTDLSDNPDFKRFIKATLKKESPAMSALQNWMLDELKKYE
ncbi:MAG: hypothetical protein V4642_04285 [Bacteroidota bacterium]